MTNSDKAIEDNFALVADGVTKRFGSLVANDNVTFSLKRGNSCSPGREWSREDHAMQRSLRTDAT